MNALTHPVPLRAALALAALALGGCTHLNPYDLLQEGDFRKVAVQGPAAPMDFLQCLQVRLEQLKYPQVVAAGFSNERPAVRRLTLREGWELRSMSGTATFVARVTRQPDGYDVVVFSNTTPGNPPYADAIEAGAHACIEVVPAKLAWQGARP